jgi:hypothetical protein
MSEHFFSHKPAQIFQYGQTTSRCLTNLDHIYCAFSLPASLYEKVKAFYIRAQKGVWGTHACCQQSLCTPRQPASDGAN